MSKSTKKKERPIMPERVSGRLPESEWLAFHPSYRVKRWVLGSLIAAVVIGLLLFKVISR